MRFGIFAALILGAIFAQWFGGFFVKIALEITIPLFIATLGLTAVAFGERASRSFGLGLIISSIPAIALTTTQFGVLIASFTPWIDPQMWGGAEHWYFIGTLIWGPLSIFCGTTSYLAVKLFFKESPKESA